MNSLAENLKKLLLAFGFVVACLHAPVAAAAGEKTKTFASPEQAVHALFSAASNNDATALLKIFGDAGKDLVNSGDNVADTRARARFAVHYRQGHNFLQDSPDKVTLVVGTEQWPFPIPIVREGGVWHFDVKAGAQEILDRRVGRNELSAMEVCRAYVQAQRDYAADLVSEQKPAEYAQKFASSPGLHDGLFWPAGPGQKESPMGPLMAHARAEGYHGRSANGERAPYHGYFYKILTRQGSAAPNGGERDYVVNGHMTAGFAMIAFPAKYGDSGVMTFIVNQDGIVYQKDLGRDTVAIASTITEFNPDLTWKTR